MSVIVVTGAARGMGRACLERLRGRADHLVAADLVAPDLDGVVGLACDVSDSGSVAALARRASELGPLQSIVHAAGISPTMGEPRRIFHVNLVGTQLVLDAFEPLVGPGSTAVCFASSAAQPFVDPNLGPEMQAIVEHPLADDFLDRAAAGVSGDSGAAYGWSKRGVVRADRAAAVTWGHRGGRVNSVSPGIIDTVMSRQEFDAHPMMKTMVDVTPLQRLGQPEEVAALVAFLTSAEASYITGIDVLIDGGCAEGMRSLMAGLTATQSES